jgi:hypothetical protein
MIFDQLKSWMGLDPINQDFNLQSSTGQGGTDFAYNTAEELYKSGDPLAQKLLRMNMMDATPSMNTMLGMQSATGGSASIGAANSMQQQNQAQNNMAKALMGMRGQDIQNSMGFNRQGMIGDQFTKSMDYKQEYENKAAQGQFFDNMMGMGSNLLLGPAGLAGTGFSGLLGSGGALSGVGDYLGLSGGGGTPAPVGGGGGGFNLGTGTYDQFANQYGGFGNQQQGGFNFLNPTPPTGSDYALKENIELVDKSNSGINIYEFDYKNKSYGDGRYRGVIAQEVPEASLIGPDGYLLVNYNKIDVQFERIKQ